MSALVIARRELVSYFLSPVAYLVLTLFLLVQGYSFWLFVELLAGRDAPHGAAMQYFFGGTFLYWLFVMFLVSTITMRLVAEERRAGTLEPLLTAPVDEAAVVLGKYLGALAFDAPDPGPIAAGYLGTLLVGASALAVGTLCSTVTRNQIVAAVACFVALVLLLLVGALGDALVRTGPWSAVLAYINLFRHMEDFGRGIVDTRHVVYHVSLAAFSLFAAARVLELRRGK